MNINTEGQIFQDRCVVFLDILGFRARVNKALRSKIKAKELSESLEKIYNLSMGKQDVVPNAKVMIFSDSVVISVEKDINRISELLNRLTNMLWALMCDGIWMRGGISIGKLHVSNSGIWGPAFIEAYDTETTLANYPRLVISGKLYNWLSESIQISTIPIKRDRSDGVYFLDVIGSQLKKLANKHELRRIKNYLDKEHTDILDNPNVYKKFSWLRREWDETLASQPNRRELEKYFSVTRNESAGVGNIGILAEM